MLKSKSNIFNALEFPVPSTNGTITLLSLENLSFVKYGQKDSLMLSSSPLWPTGWVRESIDVPPSSTFTRTLF